ncbi:stress-responsive transcription factor hsf1 [Allomyces javanicus]|nr:stress-responsive transcription factor hsf1 [Allomyces javanicus]
MTLTAITYATPGAQKAHFQACGQLGVADWVRLGPSGRFVNVSDSAIAADPSVWRDRLLPLSETECRGALEVSRMGAGKTVIALALVAASPFRSVRDMPWAGIDRAQYLVSRATLVVVRSDLVAQWVAEAQRVLPAESKIVSMVTIRDYRKVPWNDVLLADVVIVSLSFFQNSNYQVRIAKLVKTRRGRYCLPRAAYEDPPEGPQLLGFPTRWKHWRHAPNPDDYEHVNAQIDLHMADLHARGRAAFGTDTNCTILERVFWHRLVIDEVHELSHVQIAVGSPPTTTRVAETLLFTLHARFRLGLTGTPPVTHAKSIAALAEAVGVRDVPTRAMDMQAWLTSHVRRNHPELDVPRVHYRTEWVDLTPAEHGLMASFQNHGVRARLMMCNHHQIEDEVVAAAGEMAMSVEEVATRVQGARMEKMEALVARGRRQQVELAALVGRIRALIEVVPAEDLADLPKTTGLTMTADRRFVALDADVESWLERPVTIPEGPGADAAAHEPVAIPVTGVSQFKDHPAEAAATARLIVQFRFMATVLAAIHYVDAQSCPVCFEDVPRGHPIVITRCGHVFCVACTEVMLSQPVRVCAICRGDLAGAAATTDHGRLVDDETCSTDDRAIDSVADDDGRTPPLPRSNAKLAAFRAREPRMLVPPRPGPQPARAPSAMPPPPPAAPLASAPTPATTRPTAPALPVPPSAAVSNPLGLSSATVSALAAAAAARSRRPPPSRQPHYGPQTPRTNTPTGAAVAPSLATTIPADGAPPLAGISASPYSMALPPYLASSAAARPYANAFSNLPATDPSAATTIMPGTAPGAGTAAAGAAAPSVPPIADATTAAGIPASAMGAAGLGVPSMAGLNMMNPTAAALAAMNPMMMAGMYPMYMPNPYLPAGYYGAHLPPGLASYPPTSMDTTTPVAPAIGGTTNGLISSGAATMATTNALMRATAHAGDGGASGASASSAAAARRARGPAGGLAPVPANDASNPLSARSSTVPPPMGLGDLDASAASTLANPTVFSSALHTIGAGDAATVGALPSTTPGLPTTDGASAATAAAAAAVATAKSQAAQMLQRNTPQFLNKLYAMVSAPEHNDLIHWSESGTSFIVVNAEELAKRVLPRYYKHANFASFQRQLNMYHFAKIPSIINLTPADGAGGAKAPVPEEFSHEYFIRGQPDLLCMIRRKKNSGRDGPAEDPSDPSFLQVELAQLRKHQITLSSEHKELQAHVEMLWRDLGATKDLMHNQQQTIDRILRFLATLYAWRKDADAQAAPAAGSAAGAGSAGEAASAVALTRASHLHHHHPAGSTPNVRQPRLLQFASVADAEAAAAAAAAARDWSMDPSFDPDVPGVANIVPLPDSPTTPAPLDGPVSPLPSRRTTPARSMSPVSTMRRPPTVSVPKVQTPPRPKAGGAAARKQAKPASNATATASPSPSAAAAAAPIPTPTAFDFVLPTVDDPAQTPAVPLPPPPATVAAKSRTPTSASLSIPVTVPAPLDFAFDLAAEPRAARDTTTSAAATAAAAADAAVAAAVAALGPQGNAGSASRNIELDGLRSSTEQLSRLTTEASRISGEIQSLQDGLDRVSDKVAAAAVRRGSVTSLGDATPPPPPPTTATGTADVPPFPLGDLDLAAFLLQSPPPPGVAGGVMSPPPQQSTMPVLPPQKVPMSVPLATVGNADEAPIPTRVGRNSNKRRATTGPRAMQETAAVRRDDPNDSDVADDSRTGGKRSRGATWQGATIPATHLEPMDDGHADDEDDMDDEEDDDGQVFDLNSLNLLPGYSPLSVPSTSNSSTVALARPSASPGPAGTDPVPPLPTPAELLAGLASPSGTGGTDNGIGLPDDVIRALFHEHFGGAGGASNSYGALMSLPASLGTPRLGAGLPPLPASTAGGPSSTLASPTLSAFLQFDASDGEHTDAVSATAPSPRASPRW